ncbi:MAG TPA: DUF1571 domain-containing protein, partial [Gemmataceae bacterium]|nr:DUF1571 domain-containing protein [Gemmataceae bacterium]
MRIGKDARSRFLWLCLILLWVVAWPAGREVLAAPPSKSKPSQASAVPPLDPPPALPEDATVETRPSEEDPKATIEDPPDKLPANPLAELRRICKEAHDQYAGCDSYIVRLRRREQIAGKDHAEEVLALRFRKQPFSVHLKWLGQEGKGREAVFVKGMYDNKIHTLLADGDLFPLPGGKRMALAPDNPLVVAASRHSITEAGIGQTIERFTNFVEASARQGENKPVLTYLGRRMRPEFSHSLLATLQTISGGQETALPQGGQRLWFFDPKNHLPALISTQDDHTHVVEYYCYDRYQLG